MRPRATTAGARSTTIGSPRGNRNCQRQWRIAEQSTVTTQRGNGARGAAAHQSEESSLGNSFGMPPRHPEMMRIRHRRNDHRAASQAIDHGVHTEARRHIAESARSVDTQHRSRFLHHRWPTRTDLARFDLVGEVGQSQQPVRGDAGGFGIQNVSSSYRGSVRRGARCRQYTRRQLGKARRRAISASRPPSEIFITASYYADQSATPRTTVPSAPSRASITTARRARPAPIDGAR